MSDYETRFANWVVPARLNFKNPVLCSSTVSYDEPDWVGRLNEHSFVQLYPKTREICIYRMREETDAERVEREQRKMDAQWVRVDAEPKPVVEPVPEPKPQPRDVSQKAMFAFTLLMMVLFVVWVNLRTAQQ